MGALKPAATPAAVPAPSSILWRSTDSGERPDANLDAATDISTAGPSGPSELPVPRVQAAAMVLPTVLWLAVGRRGGRRRQTRQRGVSGVSHSLVGNNQGGTGRHEKCRGCKSTEGTGRQHLRDQDLRRLERRINPRQAFFSALAYHSHG